MLADAGQQDTGPLPIHAAADPGGMPDVDPATGEILETPPPPPKSRIKNFDPTQYLIDIGPKKYLQVMWRLVWLNDLHEDAQIATELISDDGSRAVFRATVTIPSTGQVGTGHGSEDAGDFGDYLEKAETKAIGRALATIGFGTQFTAYELDTRLTDTPIDLTKGRNPGRRAPVQRPSGSSGPARPAATNRPTQGNVGPRPTPPALDVIVPLNIPLDQQEKAWDKAVEEAVNMADPAMGTVNIAEVRRRWGDLRRAAEQACKVGGDEADAPIPKQRWRLYSLVDNAPTIPYLDGLAEMIEVLGAWDLYLRAAFDERKAKLASM